METCICGTQLRPYWIWRDHAKIAHASAFEPEIQSENQLMAASVRDALRAVQSGLPPKHDVHAKPAGRLWEGGCRTSPSPKR